MVPGGAGLSALDGAVRAGRVPGIAARADGLGRDSASPSGSLSPGGVAGLPGAEHATEKDEDLFSSPRDAEPIVPRFRAQAGAEDLTFMCSDPIFAIGPGREFVQELADDLKDGSLLPFKTVCDKLIQAKDLGRWQSKLMRLGASREAVATLRLADLSTYIFRHLGSDNRVHSQPLQEMHA